MFPLLLGALAGAAASVFGSKQSSEDAEDSREFNRVESEKTREFNSLEAEKARAFNADQADISRMFSSSQAERQMGFQHSEVGAQRDWSEKMANTAYQRAIADLGKAGLNPMLAYSQGGAPTPNTSSPSGAMGSSSAASGGAASSSAASANMPVRQNYVGQVLSSAQVAAQIANINADTDLKKAQAGKETSSAGNLVASTERIVVGEIPKLRAEIGLVQNESDLAAARKPLAEAQTLLTRAETLLAAGKVDQVDAETALTKVRTILDRLRVNEAENLSDKAGTSWGAMMPYVNDILEILRALVGVGGIRGIR